MQLEPLGSVQIKSFGANRTQKITQGRVFSQKRYQIMFQTSSEIDLSGKGKGQALVKLS